MLLYKFVLTDGRQIIKPETNKEKFRQMFFEQIADVIASDENGKFPEDAVNFDTPGGELITAIAGYRKENEILTQENNLLKDGNDLLTGKISEANDKIKALEDENSELKVENNLLKDGNDLLTGKISEANDKIKALEDENSELKVENNLLKKVNKAAEKQNKK